MSYHITEFETTPNPNAMKCWLDRAISDGPHSFLNSAMAASDPIASALFSQAHVTNVLFHGEWMTVSKLPEANWSDVKANVRRILEEAN